METDLKLTVSRNVRALLGLAPEESGVATLMAKGFANGSASRILAGDTDLGLTMLARLAERLRVEPWQLLVPDLDPKRLPALHEVKDPWPFRRIERASVTSLVGEAARQVEQGLLVALASVGVSSAESAAKAAHADAFAAKVREAASKLPTAEEAAALLARVLGELENPTAQTKPASPPAPAAGRASTASRPTGRTKRSAQSQPG